MISKITDLDNLKGIRISTNAFFIKKVYLRKNIKYLYKNVITITNKSKNTIQIQLSYVYNSNTTLICRDLLETYHS